MWNDRLRIVESLEGDWAGLSAADRALVRATLEKIDDDPIIGTPLFEPLRGLWSARIEGLRIIYRIVAEARFVVILTITRVPGRA